MLVRSNARPPSSSNPADMTPPQLTVVLVSSRHVHPSFFNLRRVKHKSSLSCSDLLRPCSGPPPCSVFTVASSFAVVASNPVMAFFPETSIGMSLQSRLCLPRRALLRDGLKPHVVVSPALAVVGSSFAVVVVLQIRREEDRILQWLVFIVLHIWSFFFWLFTIRAYNY
ncbi:hypothetical protein F2Q69_00021006 [Brassica cretica]|uniref:Uncharacterized protein n=1 Tax=Brassica cretica TaxID=69181 RepID=A0A8S9Q9J3_BRACR|nr:hypothetical protein F2Q69_00021006 [Brassica cretica]